MSDALMKAWSERWFAKHPPAGTRSGAAPAATYIVKNFAFDNDGNDATVVDTARIMVGETVAWQWVSGFHTVTNGAGSADPQSGTMFDQPSDTAHPQFAFAFNSAGTFPFFCRPHEGIMAGVVKVRAATGVNPHDSPGTLGFVVAPSPNPTRGAMSFQFALRTPGRARAQVFDVHGRQVAVLVDRDFVPGVHTMTWDGRSSSGARPGAGLYYVRLQLPGYEAARRIVLME
jgi:plastocyanin